MALRRGSGLHHDWPNSSMPAAGNGNTDVEAVVAGAAGNAPVGLILSLVSPINGLGSQSNVSTALAGGADIESIESVRRRACWPAFRIHRAEERRRITNSGPAPPTRT